MPKPSTREAAALMAAGQSCWNVAANAISGSGRYWVEQGEIVRADSAGSADASIRKEATRTASRAGNGCLSEAVVRRVGPWKRPALLQSVIHDYLAVDRLSRRFADRSAPAWLKGLSRWSDVVHWQERKPPRSSRKMVSLGPTAAPATEADLLAEYRDRRQATEAQGRSWLPHWMRWPMSSGELALRPAQLAGRVA